MNSKHQYSSYAIWVLVILYVVGIFGIALPIHKDFVLLTPLNLLISVATALYFHPKWTKNTSVFVITAFSIGLFVEIIGVQTGLVFGEYNYGDVLGFKIFGTPIMIGVNWVLVSYSGAMVVQYFFPEAKWLKKAILGALLLTLLDILIEPVAIANAFWSWGGEAIPIQNYVAWFAISFIILSIYFKIIKSDLNKVAITLFFLQVMFFAALNIFQL